jgi:hypothetical protein
VFVRDEAIMLIGASKVLASDELVESELAPTWSTLHVAVDRLAAT